MAKRATRRNVPTGKRSDRCADLHGLAVGLWSKSPIAIQRSSAKTRLLNLADNRVLILTDVDGIAVRAAIDPPEPRLKED